MKLNEMGPDKAMDVLCELVVPTATIAEDRELLEAFFNRVTVDEKTNEKDRKILGIMQTAKNSKIIIPRLLKTYREETLNILAIMNDKNIEEIRKQNIKEIYSQIMELLGDDEFKSFFSSQANLKAKPSSTSTSSEETAV